MTKETTKLSLKPQTKDEKNAQPVETSRPRGASEFNPAPMPEPLPMVADLPKEHRAHNAVPKETKASTDSNKSPFDMEYAPKDGTKIKLMLSKEDSGVLAFWRKTRQQVNRKWEMTGRWTRADNNMVVDFIPAMWAQAE